LKTLKLKDIQDKIFDLNQRLLFIKSVNDDTLIIKNINDENIIYAKMDELGIEYKYLDLVTAREFSEVKIKKYEDEVVKFKLDYKDLFATPEQKMWLDLLDKLEKYLIKDKICIRNKNESKIVLNEENMSKKKKKSIKKIINDEDDE